MKNAPCNLLPLLSACALLGLAGCDTKKPEAAPPPPPTVLVMQAPARDVPVYREWIGSLDGSENADIRARVAGYLTKRLYQEGGHVRKGDLLFEIDARPFEAALAQARSQLEQGKAKQLATQADADRNKELFQKKVISAQEYTNKTQMNEANIAQVAALQSAVDQAVLNLQFCRITSPVDGIAGNSAAQVGDLVGSGTNTILTSVSTLDPIKIIFPISEQEYLGASEKIQEAMTKPMDQRQEFVELLLADGSAFPHKGRLLSLDRQVQGSTGTILVTCLAKNPGNILRPGQFARARVVAKMLTGAVVVPQRAVLEVQGSYQVGVIGPDQKAEIRPVQVGSRVNGDWIITSGLKAGETIVVEGLQKLRNGAPVIAKPWSPPSAPSSTAAPAATK